MIWTNKTTGATVTIKGAAKGSYLVTCTGDGVTSTFKLDAAACRTYQASLLSLGFR